MAETPTALEKNAAIRSLSKLRICFTCSQIFYDLDCFVQHHLKVPCGEKTQANSWGCQHCKDVFLAAEQGSWIGAVATAKQNKAQLRWLTLVKRVCTECDQSFRPFFSSI